MELLERLFSLRGDGRQGRGEKEQPPRGLPASVSLNGDLAGGETSPRRAHPLPRIPSMDPAAPILAVAAVLTVALGRAVALQQAALAVIGVLHRVLLPIRPVVVFYHAVKGGSAGLIRGSPFPISHRSGSGEAQSSPGAAAGAGEHLPLPQHPQGTSVTSLEVHTQQSPVMGVFLGLLFLP